MPESLKELIANAKKKIENSYDRMSREDEEFKNMVSDVPCALLVECMR